MTIKHITELFYLDGREFLIECYRNLLLREPDEHGLNYYLGRLAEGHSKASLILQLAKSPECRPHNEISGLKQLIAEEKRASNWFWRVFNRSKELEKINNKILVNIFEIKNELFEINELEKIQIKSLEKSLRIDEGAAKLVNKSLGGELEEKKITREQFDCEEYLNLYPDVAKSGMDPFEHFINLGRFEKRFETLFGCPVYPQIAGVNDESLNLLRHKLEASWGRYPLISIIMPTYNTSEEWLREALNSVVNQVYPNWELCICDDASTVPHVKKTIDEYKTKHNRIKVIYKEINEGVSVASNLALKQAAGEYTVLLDHDDVLTPDALHYIAETIITEYPDMFYSDEIITDSEGIKIIGHAFRPAFSLELLRSHPYIVHLVGFKTALLNEIGGFDESLAISQDYDLILRATEKSFRITHIPRALYKWRTHAASAGHAKKTIVTDTSVQVLKNHLIRSGEKGYSENGSHFNFFETRYDLEEGLRTAIIIPTKNHWKLVEKCIKSIEKTTENLAIKIFVVDHDSTDNDSLKYFKKISVKHTVLKYSGEFNFSAINNWAINSIGDGFSHYLFCNNDIEALESGWLARMLELGQKRDVGVVGAKLFYPDNRVIQHAGVCVGLYGAAEHYGKFIEIDSSNTGYLGAFITNREMTAVTAACMLMRADVFNIVGGFDELAKIGFGDVDICIRVREAGYRVLFCPHASLVHHESMSRDKSTTDPHPEDSKYFQARWFQFIKRGDPFYNPNLTLKNTFWGLKRVDEFESALDNALFPRTQIIYRRLK